MSDPIASFVIPAKNEAETLEQCILSIRRFAAHIPHELIVVDNGSSDGTSAIATRLGATAIPQPTGGVSAARNTGAKHATGSILVFLDADVVLTPEWGQLATDTVSELLSGKRIVTGSHCFCPASDPRWVRVWFDSFATEPESRHVGTGHMILRRDAFETLGGFDEGLDSGEDYDFSQRALSAGFTIHNRPALKTIHLGFPKTVRQFVNREAWHGRADYRSISSFVGSKVALATSLFALAVLATAVGLVLGRLMLSLVGLSVVLLLAIASAYFKFSHRPVSDIALNACVFVIYYAGRLKSLGQSLLAYS